MRFSFARSIFSLLSGVWLVLLLAEVPGLHVCAVHDQGAEHSAFAHVMTHGAHGKAPTHEHSAKCSCLGASSHAGAVLIRSVAETLFVDPPVVVAAHIPTTATIRPQSPSPFFLPYPNGPPSSNTL
ncbi:MAG TPA: hypothetical protein VM099_09820 [Gemmatimonadaceae bacterium]|nr:hypothetical protein [Gemmatimonadaceae bacterium]